MFDLRKPVLALALLALATPALAQDADGDGVPDVADAFPCDAAVSAIQYAPSAGAWSLLVFEDQWPAESDLDFNDVAVRVHYRMYRDAQGRVARLTAQIDPLAVGGALSNGLGLQLPTSRTSATARRRVAGGAWETLAFQGDANATVILSPNLRELFDGVEGPINAAPEVARLTGQQIELEVTFALPATLNGALAPFDLFIFRADDLGHQIHLPRYRGTEAMNTALFNSGVDGTTAARAFVDRQGLPYALDLASSSRYPYEGRAISSLFPDIVGFASSGGVEFPGFYASNVATQNGFDISALALPAEPAASTACISAAAGPFTRIDVVFEEATQSSWVTMWEVGLMNAGARVTSGFTVASSVVGAALCNDGVTTGSSWCLNTSPPATYSFIATSGNLPPHSGLLLHPWNDRWPSRFRVDGRRPDGSTVTIFSYTAGNFGWAANVAREFAFATTPGAPTTGNNGNALAYTGADQSFTVPAGVTSLAVEMWGAGGGGGAPSRSQVANGGGGGYAAATVAVTPGETLTVVIGGGGGGARTGGGPGGYGGGGAGHASYGAGAGGGGRSAIRRGTTELMTAGGGGGGGYDFAGAAGGGATGLRNTGDGGGGFGGTQSAGGAGAGSGGNIGESGTAFRGGFGMYAGGGGGGGRFGGGGAGTISGYGNGGGGGSGYVGGAGVSSATLTAGSAASPGNAGGADRAGAGQGGVGVGSGTGGNGANGRVVIRY